MYFNDFIDLGSVFAFLILQDGVTYMSFYLREVFQQAQQNRVNVQRIFDILDSAIEMDPPSVEKEVVLLPDVDIRCKDLTFRYQELQTLALDNISCRIPPEKVTVITGPSGGGKSTLVKLLLGLYRQEEGNIRIGESDYSQLSLKNIHDHYSYVPQSGHLFHDSIENNIRCGNVDASFEEVIEAAKSAQAHDFIRDKPDGYQTMIQEHGTNFSGGEKQRIAIARAILKNAPVIILDEATSAVDSNTEYRIYDYLRILVENGKTVVIVTHRESALRISDHAIHIG
jgi:ATP-binding cassette subfamily B protein